MAKTKTTAEPILENEHVKELLAILRENNSSSTKDFLSVLNQVGAMEKQLDAAVKELAAMRQELKTAQEQNHPVKTALQKAVLVTQGQVLDFRERLAETVVKMPLPLLRKPAFPLWIIWSSSSRCALS